LITDLFLWVLSAPFRWLLDNVPSFTWPSWFTDTVPTKASELGAIAGALDNWFPVETLVLVFGLAIIAWGFSLSVQLLRFVVSLFSGGGGAT
jgi:hypothetical protein